MTIKTIRREHYSWCMDPDGHLLVGSPDDGTDRKEDWCQSKLFGDPAGAAVRLVDGPDGPGMRHEGARRFTPASWVALMDATVVVRAWFPVPRQVSPAS